jgi:ribonuclease HI
LQDYNGVDVNQIADYIERSAEGYIDRVLQSHGGTLRLQRSLLTTRLHHSQLMPSTGCINLLLVLKRVLKNIQCFPINAVSLIAPFSERSYAYVTCRPDIGYAVVTLSKFGSAPSSVHYQSLKGVARYLRRTKQWGIRCRRSTRDETLPAGNPFNLSLDSDLPEFPQLPTPLQLTGFVDAAHADLRNRRSATGYAFILNHGVVAYRSKTQTVTATSSNEAEFIAAVSAAKAGKDLRAILLDLGFSQTLPTPIYIDNSSAIQIINARRPTDRSRHIDIQACAIQDWKDNGEILMHHIPGVIHPSDSLTKPTGWILHSRHCRRLMGHFSA